MRLTHLSFAIALLSLGACHDATAPAVVNNPANSALLVVVNDADTRLVPALDPDARAPMHSALTELRVALEAGDVSRAQRAAAVVHALVAGHQNEHAAQGVMGARAGDTPQIAGADGADLDAIALLVEAAVTALASTP